MSSYPPPYPYFNGIDYDRNFFTIISTGSGSGLTKAQANALYLQKTTTDTATALETFSAGISTNTIKSVSGSYINAYTSTGGKLSFVVDTVNADVVLEIKLFE